MPRTVFVNLPATDILRARAFCAALAALSRDRRKALDAITEATVAAGGSDNARTQHYGFMYGRSLSDPDGNVFEPIWMDLDAAMPAGGGG